MRPRRRAKAIWNDPSPAGSKSWTLLEATGIEAGTVSVAAVVMRLPILSPVVLRIVVRARMKATNWLGRQPGRFSTLYMVPLYIAWHDLSRLGETADVSVDEQSANDAFAANLRRLREHAGYSQEGFASHAGISRGYYGKIERGEHSPSLNKMLQIAEALGVPLNELLRDVG